jgi:serine/threonine protein kinase
MNQTSPHPDESQLRGLLKGTLPSADEAAVLALLEREPAWQAALDRLVANEATWRAAAVSLQKPPLAADRTLRSVLASIASIERSHSSINTPATGETVDSSAGDADHSRDLHFLTPADDAAYLGKLGPYLVEEVIGRGGFGVVLKARDPKLARIVAIKVLAPHLAASGTACQRFRREALSAAAVAHEHVITIFAVDDDPLPYLVMQFVAGQSLQDKLDREGPLGIKEALRIGMQTAAGLAAAHKQGLVHRDIKPANILLENGIERVKLTDFGLARAADDASLTRSGTIAGTPQYMSPEQARGETVDARSDLFSLGTVLYAMLTGRSPFRADSTLAVLKRVCDDPPRPIREVNPDVPEWLAALIDRLLAKAPADRPASAQEVADLLGQYLLQVQQPKFDAAKAHIPPPAVKVEAPSEQLLAPLAPISDSVRRRINWMAYALLAVIALSPVGAISIVAIAATVFAPGLPPGYPILACILVLSFPIPLITALLVLRRASYRVLMTGTLLTLFTAALFNPVSMGLVIWVLVQLQRDDVRAALAGAKRSDALPIPLPLSADLSVATHRVFEYPQPGEKLMLAKPAKFDPFADAPPTPTRSRIATVLLGLALLLGGLTMLGCLGAVGSYFWHDSGNAGSLTKNVPVHTGRLIVEIPDRRLKATLRLSKADYDNFSPDAAIQNFNDQVQIVSDNSYRLKAGDYQLTVKSDDVTVFSDTIRVNSDNGHSLPQTYEVNRGGVLSIEAESDGAYMSVELNGHLIMENVQSRSQRMLVVPDGQIHLKSLFGNQVYAEKWLHLQSGSEKGVLVTQRSIEVISDSLTPGIRRRN